MSRSFFRQLGGAGGTEEGETAKKVTWGVKTYHYHTRNIVIVPYTYSEDGILLGDRNEEAGFLYAGRAGRCYLRTVHVNVVTVMRVYCDKLFAAVNKRKARNGL